MQLRKDPDGTTPRPRLSMQKRSRSSRRSELTKQQSKQEVEEAERNLTEQEQAVTEKQLKLNEVRQQVPSAEREYGKTTLRNILHTGRTQHSLSLYSPVRVIFLFFRQEINKLFFQNIPIEVYSPDCWSSIVVRSQIKAEVKRLENLYKMNSIHGQSTIYSQHSPSESPDNSGSPNKHNDTGYNSNTNRGYHAQLSTEAEVFSGKISIILSLTLTTAVNKRARTIKPFTNVNILYLPQP